MEQSKLKFKISISLHHKYKNSNIVTKNLNDNKSILRFVSFFYKSIIIIAIMGRITLIMLWFFIMLLFVLLVLSYYCEIFWTTTTVVEGRYWRTTQINAWNDWIWESI